MSCISNDMYVYIYIYIYISNYIAVTTMPMMLINVSMSSCGAFYPEMSKRPSFAGPESGSVSLLPRRAEGVAGDGAAWQLFISENLFEFFRLLDGYPQIVGC